MIDSSPPKADPDPLRPEAHPDPVDADGLEVDNPNSGVTHESDPGVSSDGPKTQEGPVEGASPEDAETEAGKTEEVKKGRISYAKVQEAEHLVSGRTRWSVGATRRHCFACREHLPEHQTFSTALCPVDPALVGGGVSSAFERRDFCEACFGPEVQAEAFAHWKTVLPPPPDAPRKIVNLTSLRVYFDQLTELLERAEPDELNAKVTEGEPLDSGEGAEAAEPTDVDGDSDADFGEEVDLESDSTSRYVDQWAGRDEQPELWGPLRYLLGLFLVRKRVLKWESVTDAELVLRCKQSDREYRIEIPARGRKLEAAEEAFESIFS